jgi:hypothetical protein
MNYNRKAGETDVREDSNAFHVMACDMRLSPIWLYALACILFVLMRRLFA